MNNLLAKLGLLFTTLLLITPTAHASFPFSDVDSKAITMLIEIAFFGGVIIAIWLGFFKVIFIWYPKIVAGIFGCTKKTSNSDWWPWVCFYGTGFLILIIIGCCK